LIDGVCLAVDPREVFGLLGPNGAGRPTTIGILTTRVVATSRQARVSGVDVIAHPALAGTADYPRDELKVMKSTRRSAQNGLNLWRAPGAREVAADPILRKGLLLRYAR